MRPDDPFPIAAAAERLRARRRFLCAAGAAALAALGGEWLAGPAPDPSAPLVLSDAGGLAVGEARALDTPAGGQAIAVRIDATTVVAFDRRCPHLGCPVVWAVARGRFECPCHRAAFDGRTGRVLTGPPRRGLTRIPLEIA